MVRKHYEYMLQSHAWHNWKVNDNQSPAAVESHFSLRTPQNEVQHLLKSPPQ